MMLQNIQINSNERILAKNRKWYGRKLLWTDLTSQAVLPPGLSKNFQDGICLVLLQYWINDTHADRKASKKITVCM